MYFVKRFYHVEVATTSRREVRRWLAEHEGVTLWQWLWGRLPNGLRVEYV